MARKDAVALDVGARHVDVAPDHADFWTRGVGEAPEGPSGALSPRHSSGGFRHLLFSADERHDHEILNLADIERLDALRDQIRHRGIERRAFSYWGSVKGTVTLDVLRSPFFALSFAVYAATVAAFAHPAGIEDRTLYMTTLTVLGAFLSFASIFLNKETYQRFRVSYEASTASQSAIFECATVSRLGLRDVAGRTVVRFLCAAYLAAFAGLRDSHYDVEQVLLPFVQRHGLLTEREWALLSRRGGFAATGDRYRELLAWAVGVAQRERNDGRCHPEDARRIVKPILRLRGSLAVAYHRLGQPMPFVYVHLVRILTTCYLPVFAFVLARLGSRNPAVHTLACVAICITCFFFLGINTVSVKLADPYGHDIDDLRIIAHCSAMPGACRALLTTGMDEETTQALWQEAPASPFDDPVAYFSSSLSAAGATGSPTRRPAPVRGGAPSREA